MSRPAANGAEAAFHSQMPRKGPEEVVSAAVPGPGGDLGTLTHHRQPNSQGEAWPARLLTPKDGWGG